MVREHGLPDPVWNVDLRLPGGPHLGGVDAYWPEQAVARGAGHPRARAHGRGRRLWSEYARKREHLERLGITVVHITPKKLREALEQQAAVVRTALMAAADRDPAAYVVVLPALSRGPVTGEEVPAGYRLVPASRPAVRPGAPQLQADVDEFDPFESGHRLQRMPGGQVRRPVRLMAQLAAGDPALIHDAQPLEVGERSEFARVLAADGVEAEQCGHLGCVAGLLLDLADHGVEGVLPVVHAAAGQRPLLGTVARHPAGEQDLVVPYAHGVRRDPQFPVPQLLVHAVRLEGCLNARVGGRVLGGRPAQWTGRLGLDDFLDGEDGAAAAGVRMVGVRGTGELERVPPAQSSSNSPARGSASRLPSVRNIALPG